MKSRDARQKKRRAALVVMLALTVMAAATAILAVKADMPGREGQMRKAVYAVCIAASGTMLTASALLVLRQRREKGAKTTETASAKSNGPVRYMGDAAPGHDDDITVVLSGDDDRFEIEYEITFIHTDEIIP